MEENIQVYKIGDEKGDVPTETTENHDRCGIFMSVYTHTSKLYSLEEMGKVSAHTLPKLNFEETENPNRPIANSEMFFSKSWNQFTSLSSAKSLKEMLRMSSNTSKAEV